jgi:hypothetical protein
MITNTERPPSPSARSSGSSSLADWTHITSILDAMTPAKIEYIDESDVDDALIGDAQIMKRVA